MSEFVNPYTFIPLMNRTAPSVNEGEATYTGIIRCSLTTKTQVVVPASKVVNKGDAADAGQPDYVTPFFKVDDVPVIPGSSLRGPIRSVFEQLTNSCMKVNGGHLRSLGGKKRPGLLLKMPDGVYQLYTAKRYRVVDEELYEGPYGPWVAGDVVKVTVGTDPGANRFCESSGAVISIWEATDGGAATDAIEGYFLRVNQMAGQTANKPSVFVKDSLVDAEISPEEVECLRESVKDYVANSTENEAGPFAEQYQKCLEGLDEGAMVPVWYAYEKVGGRLVFSFAQSQLSRSVYPTTALHSIESYGLKACTSKGRLCPACTLFGFVNQEGDTGECKASRVRFTDATPRGSVELGTITLPALMEPRTSAFEFYLRNEGQKHSFTPQTPGTHVAGRKAYWHHQNGVQAPEQTDSTFVANVECVKAGAVFGFDVYFDKVSVLEINELVYALSLGQYWGVDDQRVYCHKIGHGKPVGAGSVYIKVEDVRLRSCEGGAYGLYTDDSWKMEDIEHCLTNVDAVRKVSGFTTISASDRITYPRKKVGGDIFEWFGDNRVQSFAAVSTTLPGYKLILPHVMDENQYLARLIPGGDPRAKAQDKPPICETRRGTVYGRLKDRDADWHGLIFPEGGGNKVYFCKAENQHIGDVSKLRDGVKVTYVRRLVNVDGSMQPHAFALEIAEG